MRYLSWGKREILSERGLDGISSIYVTYRVLYINFYPGGGGLIGGGFNGLGASWWGIADYNFKSIQFFN